MLKDSLDCKYPSLIADYHPSTSSDAIQFKISDFEINT